MEEEINAIKEYLTVTKETKIYELTFIEGLISDKECVIVEGGVGKVNAARTAQILIDNFKIDYLLNVGVAGGIDESLNVGDIVIGQRLVQHDFDITAFDHKKGYIPNIGDYINADEELVNLATKVIKNTENTQVKTGTIASGDIFITDQNISKEINKEFDALCVEMEGASIAQVAKLCNIPFLILRSISDVPNNNNNKVTYEEFLEESTKIIAKVVNNLLKELN